MDMPDTQTTAAPPQAVTMGDGLWVVHSDAAVRRQLAQILRAVSRPVTEMPRFRVPSAAERPLLVLIDYDALDGEQVSELISFHARKPSDTRILLVSGGKCRQDFVSLFGDRVLTNLMSGHEPFLGEELLVTVQKLLHGDIFGLNKYLAAGILHRELTIRGSADKQMVLDEVAQYTSSLGIHSRLASQFSSVVDEFVSNAVYNAPVDAEGKRKYAHYSRDRAVTLEPSEYATVTLASDGRRVGVSVQDPFGSLAEGRLLGSLARCFRRDENQIEGKEGGAGLGFYHVFEQLSHFVVNIRPGARTEMIGMIDVRGSFRDFASRGKSFNLFIENQ